eukprot:jgi/Botrbrau1/10401/Bobra.0133s0010.1
MPSDLIFRLEEELFSVIHRHGTSIDHRVLQLPHLAFYLRPRPRPKPPRPWPRPTGAPAPSASAPATAPVTSAAPSPSMTPAAPAPTASAAPAPAPAPAPAGASSAPAMAPVAPVAPAAFSSPEPALVCTAGGSLRRRGTVFKGGPGRVYAGMAVTCTDVLSPAGVSEPILTSLRNVTRIMPIDGQAHVSVVGCTCLMAPSCGGQACLAARTARRATLLGSQQPVQHLADQVAESRRGYTSRSIG